MYIGFITRSMNWKKVVVTVTVASRHLEAADTYRCELAAVGPVGAFGQAGYRTRNESMTHQCSSIDPMSKTSLGKGG